MFKKFKITPKQHLTKSSNNSCLQINAKSLNQAENQTKTPLIVASSLSFNYDNQQIFSNLNFSIYKEEFIGLVGQNGSGKSTLIKLLLGLIKPTAGEILLNNTPIANFKEWGKIGYISQKASHFNHSFPASVEEVVMANLQSKIGLFRRPKKEHYEACEKALAEVGMLAYKKRLIGELSGGQQQRVFIARALVNNPSLIILDEPTIGIDSKNEEVIYQLLHKLNKDHKVAIILISHDIGAVTVHAQRLFCLGADGFFIHEAHKELEGDFLDKLYGYKVVAHSHIHHHNNYCPHC